MHRPVIGLALLSAALTVPASAARAVSATSVLTGATTRVSVASSGAQANTFSASGAAISANGRFVAFSSFAGNLVARDTNDADDVFVRDRVTGVTTRVSVGTGGLQANGLSISPAISADGRFVAFFSEASNLVTGDTNNSPDTFVRDRTTGITTRVSVGPGGRQGNGGVAYPPAISADGRFVAFASYASNLVAGDTNGALDQFVRDRVNGMTTRVSVATTGVQANADSGNPAISGDGRFVAFTSSATNLTAGDTNNADDVFVHDRLTGTTSQISVASAGTKANRESNTPTISADGSCVAFTSSATNLVTGETNDLKGVYVHNLVASTTTRVDITASGVQANGFGDEPSISGNCRYVSFSSDATNLVARDTNGEADVFVRDQVSGTTTRLSLSTAGNQANSFSYSPAISGDGRYITFTSYASNLVPGDTNDNPDVFIRDRLVAVPATSFGDFNGNGWSDLLARQTSTGYLWLYPGYGTGFSPHTRIGTGWNSMSALTRMGDFNHDHHEDVISRDRFGALWLDSWTGAGFAPRVKIGSRGWNGMREITAVGDLTGDGHPDLLAVQTSTGRLYLYPGRGTSLGAGRLRGPGWKGMNELTAVGDFNRDGHADLAVRDNATGALWLYPGNGAGLGARRVIGLRGWNGMRDLVGVGDFDRDGFNDLLAVQGATKMLMLYSGRGTSLQPAVRVGSSWTTDFKPLM